MIMVNQVNSVIILLMLVFLLPVPTEAYAISENTILAPATDKGNEATGNASDILFDANQINIENITRQLTDYGERKVNKVNTSLAADYIKHIMLQTGLSTSLEEFYFEARTSKDKAWNAAGINIVGIKEGSILRDQIILVTAHYDSSGGQGADDNAAGVASMLETARVLQNYSLNRTIYFIAFSGEEDGFLGSRAWISEHPDLAEKIVAVINIDHIAGKNLNIGYLPQYSWLKDVLNKSAGDLKIPVSTGIGGPGGGSDHVPFWENHIPAVEVIHFGNEIYSHTPEDTIDKLDFSAARDATRILVQSVYYLASTGDGKSPSVNITNPEKNSSTCTFDLTYSVSERNSTIELFLDNASLGYIKSGQRFTFTKGSHTIKVSATDGIGNTGSDSTAFTCIEIYTPATRISSFNITTDIISEPRKKGDKKTANYNTNTIRLKYNYTSNNTIFLDGIGIGDIESEHLFVLNPGVHTFEVYTEEHDGSVHSDNVTFNVKKSLNNSPALDNPALNEKNEIGTLLTFFAISIAFGIIIIFKKIKKR